jgi:hypothetical protein
MSMESQEPVYVTYRYAVSQGQEAAVVIGLRDYNRLIERLDGFRSRDWTDLWLAAAGAAAALGVSALIGALTLPPALPGPVDVLWALVSAGTAIFCLCMIGYFTQRRHYAQELSELKKDLEIHKPARGRSSSRMGEIPRQRLEQRHRR